MLAILAFNWVGYQGLNRYLQYRADNNLQQKINNGNYNEAALIELSVAINLPYANNSQGWEHFEGEIEIDGVQYRYVQRKLENDRLYVRCIPNLEKQQVLQAKSEFLKITFSLHQQASKNGGLSQVYLSHFMSDYDDQFEQRFQIPACNPQGPIHTLILTPFLPTPFTKRLINPPDLVAA